MPWGPLYRVLPALNVGTSTANATAEIEAAAVRQLKVMRGVWSKNCGQGDPRCRSVGGVPPVGRFGPQAWEFAATSVFWDAHYQLALFMLTRGLDLINTATADTFPTLLDSLKGSTELLDDVCTALNEAPNLSSSPADAVKNRALAHTRLVSMLGVALRAPALQRTLSDDLRALVESEVRRLVPFVCCVGSMP